MLASLKMSSVELLGISVPETDYISLRFDNST